MHYLGNGVEAVGRFLKIIPHFFIFQVSFLVQISIDFSSSFGDYFLWGFFNFCWWPRGHKKNYGPNQLLLSLLLSVFSQREKEIQNSHETRQQIEFGWNRAKQWETDCSGPFHFSRRNVGHFRGRIGLFRWNVVYQLGRSIVGHFRGRIACQFGEVLWAISGEGS